MDPPPAPSAETVLIVGATGNIGVSAALGALQTGRRVLAIVRNGASAARLRGHVAAADQDRVITAEADVTADDGVQGVVDAVRAGRLPAFHHVYSCVGGRYATTPLTELSTEEMRENMRTSFEPNFFAYRATVPYLLAQGHAGGSGSTWTLCTGAQPDLGDRPGPGMTQGALFALATAAARETAGTALRFNEVYLACRVLASPPIPPEAGGDGVLSAARFAHVYEQLLARPDVRGARVVVRGAADVDTLRWQPKIRVGA